MFITKVDTLDGGNDNGGGPAEHDDAVGRLKGAEKAPAFYENHITVSQGRKGASGCSFATFYKLNLANSHTARFTQGVLQTVLHNKTI